jgi:formate hydrogenlyase subunit 6/NADH:ubiquinone oxidoreductase subunit I
MTTTAKDVEAELIPIFIMGKRYLVPDALTIMKAMEYAGYQFIRGCGCRGGICGACSTVYRKAGDYKIYSGLACQTVVEPNMYLAQIPFYPALRRTYDYAVAEPVAETVHALYPEVFRCVACNACTKICPMDVEVMDYISAVKRGDLEAAKRISFDCIQCGLCASRCMGELPQYHIAQLARRLYGGKLAPKAEHLATAVEKIAAGKYQEAIAQLKAMDAAELRKVYTEREMEPPMADESWRPKSNLGLVG